MKPRLTIIGLGQLGTAIAFALKKSGAELELIGHDKSRDAITAAQKLGAVDKGERNLYNACEGAGLILMAMPLAGVLENINLLKDDVPPGVIVTDTASLKRPVLEAAQVFKPGVHFIGGHPILRPATDRLPDSAPGPDLFQNAVYCLTPTSTTDPDAVQVMTGFVSMLGAKPLFLDAAEHDGLAAGAQHLAIVVQAVFLKATTASGGWRELNKFAGDDFFQATQLAARDAASTAQILMAQRATLSSWIDQTAQTLHEFKGLLGQEDTATLEKWLKSAQDARSQWLNNQVGVSSQALDYSEVRSGALRMFVGGLATRLGGDKKK
jgi:prephenate dehydrogenase